MRILSIYHRVRRLSTFRHRVLRHLWLRTNSSRTSSTKTTKTRSNANTRLSAILTHTFSMLALLQQAHHQSCKIRPTTHRILPVDRHLRRNESQRNLHHHFPQHPLSSHSCKVLHHLTMFHASALPKTPTACPYHLSSRTPRPSVKASHHPRVLHLHPLRLQQLSICKIKCKIKCKLK